MKNRLLLFICVLIPSHYMGGVCKVYKLKLGDELELVVLIPTKKEEGGPIIYAKKKEGLSSQEKPCWIQVNDMIMTKKGKCFEINVIKSSYDIKWKKEFTLRRKSVKKYNFVVLTNISELKISKMKKEQINENTLKSVFTNDNEFVSKDKSISIESSLYTEKSDSAKKLYSFLQSRLKDGVFFDNGVFVPKLDKELKDMLPDVDLKPVGYAQLLNELKESSEDLATREEKSSAKIDFDYYIPKRKKEGSDEIDTQSIISEDQSSQERFARIDEKPKVLEKEKPLEQPMTKPPANDSQNVKDETVSITFPSKDIIDLKSTKKKLEVRTIMLIIVLIMSTMVVFLSVLFIYFGSYSIK